MKIVMRRTLKGDLEPPREPKHARHGVLSAHVIGVDGVSDARREIPIRERETICGLEVELASRRRQRGLTGIMITAPVARSTAPPVIRAT